MNDSDLEEPLYRIVCAALRHTSGTVICGARHFDHIMLALIKKLFPSGASYDQGFINNKGEFLTRGQAWIVAERAGQIRRCLSTVEGELHSEDLY